MVAGVGRVPETRDGRKRQWEVVQVQHTVLLCRPASPSIRHEKFHSDQGNTSVQIIMYILCPCTCLVFRRITHCSLASLIMDGSRVYDYSINVYCIYGPIYLVKWHRLDS